MTASGSSSSGWLPTDPEPLRRELSRFAIALLAINGIVGAGIFGLPAHAAALTGSFSPLVFVVCGVLMSTLMLSFAQASSYFSSTGGPILYTRTAFGPFVGFQTGWILYVGRTASLAANANLLATYLGAYVSGVESGVGRVVVIAALAIFFTVINILGIRRGMRSIILISIVKFLPLLIFVLVGLLFLRTETFSTVALPTYDHFGEAVLLVFYAFIGFEGSLIPAGETRNPKRDMPRAMFATAAVATILYVLIQTISVSVAPDLARSSRPLADAAAMMMGGLGAAIISLGAVMSIIGNYAASVLSAPRMTYALARDGSLPEFFGRVHSRFHTPHVSVIVYCGLGFLLGVAGTFTELAVISSFARLIGYCATLAALPVLQREFGKSTDAVRLPGGLTIPVIALLICLWLASQASLETVWKTGVLIGVGAVMFQIARSAPSKRG